VTDSELQAEFDLKPGEPFFLLIQHPSPLLPEAGSEEREMSLLLEGILSLERPVFCSYPNVDPGNVGIRRAIDSAARRNRFLRVHHNLSRRLFVALYRRCTAIVGNSSSLVIESAFLKRPAILVGPRQDLRERGDNVLRVDFDRDAIAQTCERAISDADYLRIVSESTSPYGDGYASDRIAEVLENIELKSELLLKIMPY